MSTAGLWVAMPLDRRFVWMNLALAAVIPLALVLLRGGAAPVTDYVVSAVVGVSVMACIQGLYLQVLPRLHVDPTHPAAQLATHLTVVTAGSAGGAALSSLALWAALQVPPDRTLANLFRISWVVSAVVVAVLVALDRLQGRLLDARMAEAEARQAALRAELRALQARTDPHFLFNSLNVVAGLIEEDPAGAEDLLERLASLFRYAVSAPGRSSVALSEELDAVRDYLQVQRVRLGDRLQVQLDIDDGCGAARVPPFVLQPLVENAVQHGIGALRQGGTVTVVARLLEHHLQLEVHDDGPGLGTSEHQGTGTALADLQARLDLAHGEGASVTHTSSGPGHRVTVRIPHPTVTP